MFKVNDYLEVKDIQIPAAYLEEFCEAFDVLLNNHAEQLVDVRSSAASTVNRSTKWSRSGATRWGASGSSSPGADDPRASSKPSHEPRRPCLVPQTPPAPIGTAENEFLALKRIRSP